MNREAKKEEAAGAVSMFSLSSETNRVFEKTLHSIEFPPKTQLERGSHPYKRVQVPYFSWETLVFRTGNTFILNC